MATISIAGTVTGKGSEPPVTIKTFPSRNGNTEDVVATFSVADRQYVFAKQGEERQGQFYRCEVRGKAAEICSERIKRGDKVAVSGQLVQRTYQDKLYLDVKNATVTFLEGAENGGNTGGAAQSTYKNSATARRPQQDEMPF